MGKFVQNYQVNIGLVQRVLNRFVAEEKRAHYACECVHYHNYLALDRLDYVCEINYLIHIPNWHF